MCIQSPYSAIALMFLFNFTYIWIYKEVKLLNFSYMLLMIIIKRAIIAEYYYLPSIILRTLHSLLSHLSLKQPREISTIIVPIL